VFFLLFLDTLSNTDEDDDSNTSDGVRSTIKKRRATDTAKTWSERYKDSDVGVSSSKNKKRRRMTEHKNEKRYRRFKGAATREGSPFKLPNVVFHALFRMLPAYKRSIDGTNNDQKQEAWRAIVAKLQRDPKLRRELGPDEADTVIAELDPVVLMHKFVELKQNARAGMRRRRREG
jgi:hypothetical protein